MRVPLELRDNFSDGPAPVALASIGEHGQSGFEAGAPTPSGNGEMAGIAHSEAAPHPMASGDVEGFTDMAPAPSENLGASEAALQSNGAPEPMGDAYSQAAQLGAPTPLQSGELSGEVAHLPTPNERFGFEDSHQYSANQNGTPVPSDTMA